MCGGIKPTPDQDRHIARPHGYNGIAQTCEDRRIYLVILPSRKTDDTPFPAEPPYYISRRTDEVLVVLRWACL